MEPRRVPKHPILHRSPVCTLFGRFWVPFGSHFGHRFRHFWGTFFFVFLGTLKNTFSDSWGYQNGAILEVFFWHLFGIGPKSIFEDPYIENTAFSLPEGSQNEVKIDVKMGTPKRTSQNTIKVPKVTPKGDPMGTVFAPKTVPKKDPQK